VPAEQPQRSYTRQEVCRLLKIRENVLEQWEDFGFVRPSSSYGFRDLVALETLRKLRKSRVRPARIRLILQSLRQKLGDVKDPLRELKVFIDGRKFAFQVDGRRMEPLSGQLLLDFDRDEIRRLLDFPKSAAQREQDAEAAARRHESDRWFEKGVRLEQTGAPLKEAEAAYRQAIQIDPSSAGALLNLGTLYYHQRKNAEAERCYRQALQARPDYPLAHFNLAILFDESGDWESAVKHYLAALDLDPNYADAHYNLALLYQNLGETLKSVRHWRQYLKIEPSGYWAGIARRELSQLRRSTVIDGTGG
jgi:tetratricopeptide (TPR) repeat protein